MSNVDRECLKFAWETISIFLERRGHGRDVLRYSRRAGSMIFSDGLLATLAFAYSKASGEEAWMEVVNGVVKWLNKRGLLKHVLTDKVNYTKVFKELSEMEEWQITLTEKEAVRFLSLLARLCEGEFGEETR